MAGERDWLWWLGGLGLFYVLWPKGPLGINMIAPVENGWLGEGWGNERTAYRFHMGIDIGGNKGQPIRSALAGQVIDVDNVGASIEGRRVVVRSGGGVVVRYLHLDRIDVKLGQQVSRGETLGTLGETGNAITPHLHLDMGLSDDLKDAYIRKFGQPTPEINDRRSWGWVVPAEPFVPVDRVTDLVRQRAKARNVPILS